MPRCLWRRSWPNVNSTCSALTIVIIQLSQPDYRLFFSKAWSRDGREIARQGACIASPSSNLLPGYWIFGRSHGRQMQRGSRKLRQGGLLWTAIPLQNLGACSRRNIPANQLEFIMSSPDVVLQQFPYPVNNSRGSEWLETGKDATFCSTCCNFAPLTAFILMPRADIFAHVSNGEENVRKAKAQGTYSDVYIVPSWAGIARLDYTSWQFTAKIQHLVKGAAGGCPSCSILATAVMRMNAGIISEDTTDAEIDVVFCRDDAMRVWLYRVAEDSEDMDLFGEVHPPERSEVIMVFEMYTLPGMDTVPSPSNVNPLKCKRSMDNDS
jgi:hypothetical protein